MEGYLIFGSIMAAAAMVSAFGQQIKGLAASFQRIWLAKIDLDPSLSGNLYKYCNDKMKLSKMRSKVLVGCKVKCGIKDADKMVSFDLLSQSSLIFRHGFKILWTLPGKWVNNPSTNKYERTVTCYLPRFMWNSEKFMNIITSYCDDENDDMSRFKIERFCGINKNSPTIELDATKRADIIPISCDAMLSETKSGRAMMSPYKLDDLYTNKKNNPFDWYSFDDNIMEAVERARQWIDAKNWYREKHIPWNRGWLLHGKPGTGKTLLLRCVAQYLNIPIFILDIPSMSNNELIGFWEKCLCQSPCMILLEDFDNIFHTRDNRTDSTQGVTFDCLINCISGANQSEGVFLAITANNIDKIDSAIGGNRDQEISSRPGRVDEVIELGEMSNKCKYAMAQKIVEDDDIIEDIMDITTGMTAAQFTETCTRLCCRNNL